MIEFNNLYARNSNGSINVWEVSILNKGVFSEIIISEGNFNGKKTETIKKINKGKNLLKMNATTAFEQACSEAESRWNKKRKQGYKSLEDLGIDSVEDLEEALPRDRTDENNKIKPMKAKPYYVERTEKGKKIKTNIPLIKFPCFGQPKLNGFRVMASWEEVEEGEGLFKTKVEKVVFRSKEGLKYTILEHIEKEFDKSMFLNSKTMKYDVVFDGEMYIHGEILSEISSAVRKRNSKTPLLKFHIFDLGIEDMKQSDRLKVLKLIIDYKEGSGKLENICRVDYLIVNTNEEAQTLTDQWIKEKYEGGIFRDMKANYQFGKRPSTMTKLKRSEDKEFTIMDVIAGENATDLGVFRCMAENGEFFNVNPEGNHEAKREYLVNKNKYIGKQLTVRFFERTKNGVPFHGVGVVRDYE